MKLYIVIFLILIYVFRISVSTAEIADNLDLIIIDKDAKLIESSFIFNRPNIFNKIDNNSSSISYIKKNDISLSFFNIPYSKLSIDLKTGEKKYDVSRKPIKANKQLNSINLAYLFNEVFIFSNANPFIKLNYTVSKKRSLQCFEFGNNIIGVDENICSQENKNFVQSKLSDDITLEYNSGSMGFDLGLKYQSQSWKNKRTLEYGMGIKKINFDIVFGDNTNNFPANYDKYLPNQNPWLETVFSIKYKNVNQIGNNWSFGYGISNYIVNSDTEEKLLQFSDSGKNIALELKLTKLINSQMYISFDTLFTTDHMLGIETDYGIDTRSSINKSFYNQFKISFGINPKPIYFKPRKDFSIEDELNQIFAKNELTNTDKPKLIESKTIKENQEKKYKSNMTEFALNYARNYDNQNYGFLNK